MTRVRQILLCLLLIIAGAPSRQTATAQPIIPVTWDVLADNFESGSLAVWSTVGSGNLSLVAGSGRNGSTGLAITVGQGEAYIYQYPVAYAVEGYLTFWLDPNGVALPEPSPNYWPPGTSLCVGQVRSSASDWWPPLTWRLARRADRLCQQHRSQFTLRLFRRLDLRYPRQCGHAVYQQHPHQQRSVRDADRLR